MSTRDWLWFFFMSLSLWDPGWPSSLYLRFCCLIIKGKQRTQWHQTMALKASAHKEHMSLARASHMAKPEVNIEGKQIFFKRFYLFIFRLRWREGEKHQYVVASHTPHTRDPACNPGMCPDWESNQLPFGSQASTQSTEPQQTGQKANILINYITFHHGQISGWSSASVGHLFSLPVDSYTLYSALSQHVPKHVLHDAIFPDVSKCWEMKAFHY